MENKYGYLHMEIAVDFGGFIAWVPTQDITFLEPQYQLHPGRDLMSFAIWFAWYFIYLPVWDGN